MKFVTLPIYRLPTLLLATKEGFKSLRAWCFPCTSGAAPVIQPGTHKFITEDQSTEPFDVFMTFLRVLQTPSLHIEMVMYRTSYTSNSTCQIAYKWAYSLLVLKYAIKIINFLSKGSRVTGPRNCSDLKKVVPTSKNSEKC